MERYGLIGRPLGHSFSASFFAEKFASEGIDAVYENHELPELAGHFMELVDSTPNLRGLNVTIPYKQDVIPLLNELSDDARAIGAVNVISISRLGDGRPHLKGYNSDVIGFTESIKPLLHECHKKPSCWERAVPQRLWSTAWKTGIGNDLCEPHVSAWHADV